MKSAESKKNSTKLTMRSKVGDSTKGLDTEQVLSIMESCARHGVTTLKFRDLEFTRGPQAPQATEPEPAANDATQVLTPDATMSESQKPNEKAPVPLEDFEQPELELREDQIAELQLTDPLLAEQMMMSGELQDAGTNDGDDE